jgi:thiamine biosynthesis lipoprotein
MIKPPVIISVFLACVLGLTSCQTADQRGRPARFEFQSAHMGTLFSLILYAGSGAEAEAAAEAAFRRVAELENTLSDYQADSELNLLRTQPPGTPIPVSADLFDVLVRAQRFSAASGGAFDVTVGPLVRQWRFSRKRKQLPAPEEFAQARASVGWKNLRLDAKSRTVTMCLPGMQLDVGGIAKGYAADEALAVLRQRGITRALMAASGDIVCGDPPPGARGWTVGIAAVAGTNLTHTIRLAHAAVSTSGDSEQYVEIDGQRYSHIVSPWTGLGLTNRIQTTVIARDGTHSDALATTICILGPERGRSVLRQFSGAGAVVVIGDRNQSSTQYLGSLPRLTRR